MFVTIEHTMCTQFSGNHIWGDMTKDDGDLWHAQDTDDNRRLFATKIVDGNYRVYDCARDAAGSYRHYKGRVR